MDKKSLIIFVTAACVCVICIGYFYENFYQYDDIKSLEKELSLVNPVKLWYKSEVVEDENEIKNITSKLENIFSYRVESYFVAENGVKKLDAVVYVDKRKETSRYIYISEEDVYRICNSSKRECIKYYRYENKEIIKYKNRSVEKVVITCNQGPFWTPLALLAYEKGGYIVKKMYYNNKPYYIFGHDPEIMLIVDKNGIPLFGIRCILENRLNKKSLDELECNATTSRKTLGVFKDVNKDIDFGNVSWINEKNIYVTEFASICW